jgi:heme-degrading monooxygenase HmoA
MQRRTYLKTVLAGAGSLAGAGPSFVRAAGSARPIELHVDLSVDPSKEAEMLNIFKTQFRPAAREHPGYIDAKMLKLRSPLQGKPPQGMNYRFVLTYESEEQRKAWVASAIHNKLWPMIESTLTNKDYTVLLFDVA